MHRSLLLRSGSSADSAVATVVADVRIIVDDNRLVINVGDVGDVNVVHTAVVKVAVALPLSTIKTITGIAKSVINPAVKSDVRTPVPFMKDVRTAAPSPISRRPEKAYLGRTHPYTRHPVVSRRTPMPIPRRP